MIKTLTLVILFFLLSSCDQSIVPTKDFKWATVDNYKIEQRLKYIANEQNPYPPAYQYNKDQLNFDYNSTRALIRKLEKTAKIPCLVNEKEKTKENKSASSRDIRSIASVSAYSSVREIKKYDGACLSKIEDGPLIVDLKEKLEKINTIKSKQKIHNSKISEVVRKQAAIAISAYAKNKFDVVFGKNTKLMYNENGLSLDITQAVLNEIDSSAIKISISLIQ